MIPHRLYRSQSGQAAFWLISRMLGLMLLFGLTACTKEAVIKVGFLADLSSRNADLAVAGRNGAMLAVEQFNAAGGLYGKKMALQIKDATSRADALAQIDQWLGQGVEAIIGPMSSSMAAAIVPKINQSPAIMISPTVTGEEFFGKDDNFFLLMSSVSKAAAQSARYQAEKLHRRRIAVIYAVDNFSYSYDWLQAFWDELGRYGGEFVDIQGFDSSVEKSYSERVAHALESRPDAILLIGGALDTALLCQNIRKQSRTMPIVISGWSSTARFIEMAGKAAEGVWATSLAPRMDTSVKLQQFVYAYQERFGMAPGFAGLAAFDATQLLIQAYVRRAKYGSLKRSILGAATFSAVDAEIPVNSYGEARRDSHIVTVKNGHFALIE